MSERHTQFSELFSSAPVLPHTPPVVMPNYPLATLICDVQPGHTLTFFTGFSRAGRINRIVADSAEGWVFSWACDRSHHQLKGVTVPLRSLEFGIPPLPVYVGSRFDFKLTNLQGKRRACHLVFMGDAAL
jgi:hypothetical protein